MHTVIAPHNIATSPWRDTHLVFTLKVAQTRSYSLRFEFLSFHTEHKTSLMMWNTALKHGKGVSA